MNQLNVSLQHSITTLAAHGWSHRRIARELDIHRETVGRHLRLADSKPAKVLTGSAPDPAAKPAIPLAGSEPVPKSILNNEILFTNGQFPIVFRNLQGTDFLSKPVLSRHDARLCWYASNASLANRSG
jgi:Homeodomain-like domain